MQRRREVDEKRLAWPRRTGLGERHVGVRCGCEGLDRIETRIAPTSRGELVARNLDEDRNVPPEHQTAFRRFSEDRPPAGDPHDAVVYYGEALAGMASAGLTFAATSNAANRLPDTPLSRLARAVDLVSFAVFNHPVAVTRAEARRRTFQQQLAKRLATAPTAPAALRADIGAAGRPVWAADDTELTGSGPGPADPDRLRDRLGLDDVDRFGQDSHVVIFRYDVDVVPDGACYRPTVLDAGWHPAAGAFLPSDRATDATGYTQDLASGDKGVPEVIHEDHERTTAG